MPPRIDPERVERPGLPSTILGPPAGRSLPFAGLLLAAACSGGPPADGPRHPDPVRIVGGSSAEVELPVAPAPVPDDPLRGAGGEREAMGSTDPAMVIGRLEGPPEAEVFGRIQDVARDARGRLLVLDAQARDLRVFDTSGAWIQTVGGPGPGPGELLHPRAVAADDQEDAVYIFGATGRVVRFLPAYRRVAGPQLLMVYVGNSQCVWSEDASLPDAVERIKVRLAEQAEKQGMSFKAVGVALDWHPEAGLEHLENFGRFDEISSGYNWANTLALEYLWSDREVSPSTPQILVYERHLVAPRDSTDPLLYAEEGPRRILVKRGLAEIVDWAESGVSVPGS